jgi:hypothetical protein
MRIYADWPMRIQIRNTAQNQNLLSAVLWIGTILILIWIQISMLVPSRSGQRSGLALKQGRSSCGSFSKIYMYSTCWKIRFYFSFSHSFATLQCFIFLISVKCVKIFSILDSILRFLSAWNWHNPDWPDPDRHALKVDPYPDSDPAK